MGKRAALILTMACILTLAGCGDSDNAEKQMEVSPPALENENTILPTGAVPDNTDADEAGDKTAESDTASAALTAEQIEAVLPDCEYALAYYEFLEEYAKESTYVETGRAKFSLVFIDDDEVPELLLFAADCHAAGVDVYTYYQNEVIGLGLFGSFGKMQYVERGGMIFDHYMGQGEASSNFFQLDGGTVVLINSLHSGPDYEEGKYVGEYYEIDGGSVSEEMFEAKWDELYESREYVLIGYDDGIAITEAGLASLLAEAINSL